jgi:hypothetical protein
MVKNNSIFSGCRKLILATVLAGFAWAPAKAYCQTDRPVLLLQQIPPNGGKITPDAGVHHIELNTSVTLTADPQPGYQFVYWLGDVSDPTSNRTTAYLNAPKIIVAIFERAEYELEDVLEIGPGIPGRFGGARRASAADYSRQGYSGGGAKRPSTRRASTRPPEPPLPPPEVPVPIPEPATVVLFTIGSLLTIAGRRIGK